MRGEEPSIFQDGDQRPEARGTLEEDHQWQGLSLTARGSDPESQQDVRLFGPEGSHPALCAPKLVASMPYTWCPISVCSGSLCSPLLSAAPLRPQSLPSQSTMEG